MVTGPGTGTSPDKENTMTNQNTSDAIALDPPVLREILVADVGIDPEELSQQPETPLADLGLDSIAQVELAVVLQERHGVAEIPDNANSMSFGELAVYLCGAV